MHPFSAWTHNSAGQENEEAVGIKKEKREEKEGKKYNEEDEKRTWRRKVKGKVILVI